MSRNAIFHDASIEVAREIIRSKKSSFIMSENQKPNVDLDFAWRILDNVLRGTFKHHETGQILLPFVVLRRLDCMLEPSSLAVRESYEQFKNRLEPEQLEVMLRSRAIGPRGEELNFYNTSGYDLVRLAQDPQQIRHNWQAYLRGYNEEVQQIMGSFELDKVVLKLERNGLLWNLVDAVSREELGPERYDNHSMGLLFEELIRISNEQSNETAGEHFTPRDVVQLMGRLLLTGEEQRLKEPGVIQSIYDLCCGTGGMLSVTKSLIKETHPDAIVSLFGQEVNEQAFAIAKSDLLISGDNPGNIRHGNTLIDDRHEGRKFRYQLANPPYGVTWKREKPYIDADITGRFPHLPRVSDGQLLFVQHMLHKMKPTTKGGGRIAVITNGSPLFTGDAGSGESDTRKMIIENDQLEALIALPEQMFFNTGIATYVWVLTNVKEERRRGKVQLIDAREMYVPLKKSLNNKRREISPEFRDQIVGLLDAFEEGEHVQIHPNDFFGYRKVTVERPLLDGNGEEVKGRDGVPKPDAKLRDTERIPLGEDVQDFMKREVLPHVPDAWVPDPEGKVGYEVNFTKYFYRYEPLRPSEDIAKELTALDGETQALLQKLFG